VDGKVHVQQKHPEMTEEYKRELEKYWQEENEADAEYKKLLRYDEEYQPIGITFQSNHINILI